MKFATYLYFKNNAQEVIETYQTIFDAKVVCKYIYNEKMTKNHDLLGKIFHAELKIGDLNLYIADSGKDSVFSSVEFVVEFSEENKARECFNKIVQNGKPISDFQKMSFGPTIALAEDKFKIKWNVVIC